MFRKCHHLCQVTFEDFTSLNCRNVCLTFHVCLLLPKDLKTIQQIRHCFIFNLYSYGRHFVFAKGHWYIFPQP